MPFQANTGSSLRMQPNAQMEKRSAALLSISAACTMTALKLAVALSTGSLGILSDAIHSGVDLLASALTFVSVRISDRPADANHPYGHARFENISAFIETFLMVASALWITTDACRRIFFHPVQIRYSFWPLLVLAVSVCVDLWRSHQMHTVAQRHGSAALEADALHFRTDIWATAAVFLGLIASWISSSHLGRRFHLGWLHYSDPVAAILVSAIIVYLSWKIAHRAIYVLTDAVPRETLASVLREVRATKGVITVDQLRMRRSGTRYFADLTLSMPRQLTFQRSEQLVAEATRAVHRIVPEADVVIHTVPRSTSAESIFDKVRAVASRNNVMLHDVSVQSYEGGLHVEQHIEVPETMPLRQAHEFVRGIEDQIRAELPQVESVLTHIESEPATIEKPVALAQDEHMEAELRASAATLPEVIDIHEVLVGRAGETLSLSCHCTLPDDLPMQRVHAIITALEDRFKLRCPEVDRVLIHPEPATDNHHG
jgi:cation diffusion facilitator family transporter